MPFCAMSNCWACKIQYGGHLLSHVCLKLGDFHISRSSGATKIIFVSTHRFSRSRNSFFLGLVSVTSKKIASLYDFSGN